MITCKRCAKTLPDSEFELCRNQWGTVARRRMCHACRREMTLVNYYRRSVGLVQRRYKPKRRWDEIMSRQDYRIVFNADPQSDMDRRTTAAMNTAASTKRLFHRPLNARILAGLGNA